MKNIKFLAFAFATFLLVGCEDYFGADSNVDPDNPISVNETVILPQVQARLAYTYGGDFARYLGINTHHVDGIARQHLVFHNYGIIGSDCDAAWSNIFTGTLQSNRRLIQQAEEKGFNHFAGVGKALEAFTMMAATDFWGDLPYSDALRFDEVAVYSPTFDSQQSIYEALFALIDEARGALQKDDGGFPLAGDLFYGGDASKWVKFLNVLEARGRLHLSKINGDAAYTAALAALDKGGFANRSEGFAFSYGSGATENAPMFQFIQQRGDTETGAAYVALLQQFNDPRLTTYGQPVVGHPIFVPNQLQQMLSYTEQEFIRAEANLMLGNKTEAYTAYLAGIRSSFAEAALSSNQDTVQARYDEYVAQSTVGVGESNLTLKNIITQKYLALLAEPEVFNDWRRTGYPELTPNVGSQIPRRLPYAQTEVFSNDNLDASPKQFHFHPYLVGCAIGFP
ncbi:MAG: SusD/RagB family nutrient-binding outer membrane lipoprotein [Saprospiraceae bacterium]